MNAAIEVGIDGVNRFLKRLWALFYKGDTMLVNDDKPSKEALKALQYGSHVIILFQTRRHKSIGVLNTVYKV